MPKSELVQKLAADSTPLLSDRIRNALTDEIAEGTLAAGTALDEQQIANRFGASRTPVREALKQLSANGLVQLLPRRGVIVTRMTAERVMNLFEAMAEVEAMCARLATHRMTPLERSHLLQLHEASQALVLSGDVDGYDKFNKEFHEALYRATHNEFMADQAMSLRTRLNAFRRMQLRDHGRVSRSRDEHAKIMQAIAEGDGEMAARHMRAHMLNAATALDRYIDMHVTDR